MAGAGARSRGRSSTIADTGGANDFRSWSCSTLGGGASGADLDAWGTSAIHTDGCICTRLPSRSSLATARWTAPTADDGGYNGRLQPGDGGRCCARSNLPSLLARPVLAVAMQDFIDELAPDHATTGGVCRARRRRFAASVSKTTCRWPPPWTVRSCPKNRGLVSRALTCAALLRSILRRRALAAVAFGVSGALPGARDALPSAQILSPEPDSYATGVVLLRAVDRSVDAGRQRHVLRRRPTGLHRRRSARSSASGTPAAKSTRIRFAPSSIWRTADASARTVRTKGLGFADNVNVEVVQVTVTVTDDSGHFVGRHSALGVQSLRRRQAADDHLFRVGGRAARADRRRRHQRQHDDRRCRS